MHRWIAAASLAAALVALTGCPGPGCGVGPVPYANSDGKTVTFNSATVGASQTMQVPFQDSVNASETIDSITVTGADAAAFVVVSTFPMNIPAGQQVAIEMTFTPSHVGQHTATLTLNTAGMGPSPVELEGAGTSNNRDP